MAVYLPLTSSLHDVPEDRLTGITNINGPLVRRVHRALDACAAESGSFRIEEAMRADFPAAPGSVWLLKNAPSAGLAQLLEAAPGAREVFGASYALPDKGEPPRPRLTVIDGSVEEPDGEIPLSVFLAMLERDPQTSPSSLERLFDDLAEADKAGLVKLTATTVSLTDAGRELVAKAGPALDRASDKAIEAIDLYAQEVADGRMTLQEAFDQLGVASGAALGQPGDPDEGVEVTPPAPHVRTSAGALSALVAVARDVPDAIRLDLVVLALCEALVAQGVPEDRAEARVRNDLRLLRLFGGSLSHGLPTLRQAREKLLPEFGQIVDVFLRDVPADVVEEFILERPVPIVREVVADVQKESLVEPEPDTALDSDASPRIPQKRADLFSRIVARIRAMLT